MASRSSSLVEGPLSKWTNVVSGWQYRWFVLDQSAGLLAYYTVSICVLKHSITQTMTQFLYPSPYCYKLQPYM